MDDQVRQILNRYSKASGNANHFYSLYKRAYELCAPNYNNVDKGSGNGSTNQKSVSDSTMARAADSFVNTFITTVCPPQTRWAELEASDMEIERISLEFDLDPKDVKEGLNKHYQKITDKLFSALNMSNFYSVLDQFAHDSFMGTGCLLVQRSNDLFDSASPLDFTAIPPLDIAVELSSNQKITAIFRQSEIKRRDVKHVWPEFKMDVFKDASGQDREDAIKTFTEAWILDPEYIRTPSGKELYKRWKYVVIVDDAVGYEDRHRDNPLVVFFWSLLHGENVGRGLAIKAMGDANELQMMVDLKNRWLQMYGFGMYSVVASKMYNAATAKIRPNNVFMVKDQGAIQPIQASGNPQAQQFHIQELRDAIKETCLDFQIPNDPNMTATQVNMIAQRQLQIFAGVVGRIQFQLLWPILQNCLNIMIEDKLIQLPSMMSKIDSRTTSLKILSPIGRVQNMNDLTSLMSALQHIGQIDPGLIPAHVKVEDLPSWIFNQTGSPAKFLKSEEETQQFEAQQQQAQMAQQAMEMAQQAPVKQ